MRNRGDVPDLVLEFEMLPESVDETDVSLRSYIARLDPLRLEAYDPGWSDERVLEWEENFRSDGTLMLVCCERDVEVEEYRRVLEEFIEFRARMAGGGGGGEGAANPGT